MNEAIYNCDCLFDDLKNHLNITWDDERTDAKIRALIASGIDYIDGKLGDHADYRQIGAPRTMLFEYVRYSRDEALDVFENNYMPMLLAMQNAKAVSEYVASTAQTE